MLGGFGAGDAVWENCRSAAIAAGERSAIATRADASFGKTLVKCRGAIELLQRGGQRIMAIMGESFPLLVIAWQLADGIRMNAQVCDRASKDYQGARQFSSKQLISIELQRRDRSLNFVHAR